VDTQLFELAFTHRSFAFEHGRIPSNERLEFLGDAVLQIVVTEHIFRSFPDLAEGQLAKLRASVVSSHALAEVARGLDLGELIRLGQGEINTGGADKTSILADTMEAVIGAIHMSCGADAAACFVHALLDERIASSELKGHYTDYKTALQEYCAHSGLEPPRYQIVGEDEADLKLSKISVASPLARALIGKYAGDVASFQAPGGEREYEILDVLYR